MNLRPPAIPLVTHDPYFSIWSFNDTLTDDAPRHWTGAYHPFHGLIRVDGTAYRFISHAIDDEKAAKQVSCTITATKTEYTFEAGDVLLTLTFLTPALLDDLDVLSRPLTYIDMSIRSRDAKAHNVELLFIVRPDLAVNDMMDEVVWARFRHAYGDVLRVSAARPCVLERSGDNLRADWGNLYFCLYQDPASTAASVREGSPTTFLAPAWKTITTFAKTGAVPDSDDMEMPRPVVAGFPSMCARFTFTSVTRTAKTASLLLAFDDVESIEFLKRRLPPYWRRNGMGAAELIACAMREKASLQKRCAAFDAWMHKELVRAGGEKYADLCTLAYRQSISAHKLVADVDGTPLFFSKENFSNGCIATVDITYPSSPLYLWLNPTLLKGMLKPVLEYAALPRWTFDFAPHDLGTYPLANGQIYGGGEKSEKDQMPVEECGNMLILMAAACKEDGSIEFAKQYWHTLSQWARYLEKKGYDPAHQLCTDDFAGHLGHNVNLSAKAITALGAYAQMAKKLGHAAEAKKYRALAEKFAQRWLQDSAGGESSRLAFDKPGTWSQKYNLAWERYLGLKLFPDAFFTKEMAFYRKAQTALGLPLDCRKTYAKCDWTLWSATLTGKRDDFDALLAPVWNWANTTSSRVPLSDWYETSDGKHCFFQARSVVGGFFFKALLGKGKG